MKPLFQYFWHFIKFERLTIAITNSFLASRAKSPLKYPTVSRINQII